MGADEQLMGLTALPLMASSNFKPATVKVEMYHEVLKKLNSQFKLLPCEHSSKCEKPNEDHYIVWYCLLYRQSQNKYRSVAINQVAYVK